MKAGSVEDYLRELTAELRKRGVFDTRLVEETREHLRDAVAEGERNGLSPDAAGAEAVERFGEAQALAAKFAAQRYRTLHTTLLVAAVALGLAIAWIDSRPHWDDAGITAGMLLLSAGALGLAGPRRPWLWALAVGIWIPATMIARTPTLGNILGSFVILAFPFAGAYAGMALRRMTRLVEHG
jgi:hypothetical protein